MLLQVSKWSLDHFIEISILEDEKTPRALVQILSPGGARGVYLVLPS
jgi:hypothetical protein